MKELIKITAFIYLALQLSACSDIPEKQVNTKKLKAYVEFLADDDLEGREFGTMGEQKAAEFIANEFEINELRPMGTDGYYQPFDVSPSLNPHEQAKIGSKSDSSITGKNVVAMLDNSGDQVVIIGAHYDHLGYGGTSSLHRGDSMIHNGADDNASGVAILLELSKSLQNLELENDVLFIAFTGEEKGLWGSNYFSKNSTIDMSKVTAMINMDMVGRLNEEMKLVAHGTGTSPDWENILNQNNMDSLNVIMKPSGVGPSDHTSFYLQDLPVLHFFTGQHSEYHKPEDDADLLNYDGMLLISNYVERIITTLDSMPKLEFTKTKEDTNDTPRFKVGLGVVPDYLFDGEGMRIDGVSEGKPAAAAGLQKGDIVSVMGDSTITDMMSYMRALSVFDKGDTTEIIVDRDGEKKTFTIVF